MSGHSAWTIGRSAGRHEFPESSPVTLMGPFSQDHSTEAGRWPILRHRVAPTLADGMVLPPVSCDLRGHLAEPYGALASSRL